ncbi:MAG: hypothetical protein H0V17_04555, partial [Deltaproteobacteria bacterium]|nr:hypothetical protein [Deltaproteobacteria bacterium]
MTIRTAATRSVLLAAISTLACGGPTKAGPSTKKPEAKPASAPDTKPVAGPIGEKAATLREAAILLEKAASTLADGNKSLAEQQFSFAEQLVGVESLAS